MRALLQEIIDAGQGAELPLDMTTWHCGSACCLCGDVAIRRLGEGCHHEDYSLKASRFSRRLQDASRDALGTCDAASAIFEIDAPLRIEKAKSSGLFTDAELQHPHLTTNHHDRAIAHDWIRVVMSKLPEDDK
jgi:hypothetical protein